MRRYSRCLLFATAVGVYGIAISSVAAARSLESVADTAYTRYKFVPSGQWRLPEGSPFQYHPARVFRAMRPDDSAALLIAARNQQPTATQRAVFSLYSYPPLKLIDDDGPFLVVNDWRLFDHSITVERLIASAGYRRDSAFAFTLDPLVDSSAIQMLPLCSGYDSTENGVWEPDIQVVLLEDYDFDGYDEVIYAIHTTFECQLRELHCVELETMRLEWSLPVAPLVRDLGFFSLKDSANPGVLFVSYNPKQGAEDSLFTDRYAYLTSIDATGRVTMNLVAGIRHGGVTLCRSRSAEGYYLTHEIELAEPDRLVADSITTYRLSKLDRRGRILRTTSLGTKRPTAIWIHPDSSPEERVAVSLLGGEIVLFDSSLTPVRSYHCGIFSGYVGQFCLPGSDQDLLVLADGLYLPNMELLTPFPFWANALDVLARDEQGGTADLVLTGNQQYTVGRIQARTTLELASAFYHHNQEYVLMALSGLAVALVLVNYYGSRTRRILKVVTTQKAELEVTHRKLRDTQEQLIEAEKYKQAQGIAGGFAHEIRNALLPSEGALLQLGDMDMGAPDASEKLARYRKMIGRSVDRALDLTDLVSTYARLDSEDAVADLNVAEALNETIKTNENLVSESGTTVSLEVPSELRIACSPQRFHVIFNNLLLNSLEATRERPRPVIRITASRSGGNIHLVYQDNGTGIPEVVQDRVFDMFFTTRPKTGTGLGLAMARRMAQLSGGTITLADSTPAGTSFEIELPASAPGEDSGEAG